MTRGTRSPATADGVRDAGPTAERRDRDCHTREEHGHHDDAGPPGTPASDLPHGFTSTSAHDVTLQRTAPAGTSRRRWMRSPRCGISHGVSTSAVGDGLRLACRTDRPRSRRDVPHARRVPRLLARASRLHRRARRPDGRALRLRPWRPGTASSAGSPWTGSARMSPPSSRPTSCRRLWPGSACRPCSCARRAGLFEPSPKRSSPPSCAAPAACSQLGRGRPGCCRGALVHLSAQYHLGGFGDLAAASDGLHGLRLE